MSDKLDYRNEIVRAGFIPVDSFEAGFTLTSSNQALYSTGMNEFFIWKGALPKGVAAGSKPENTGGFGPAAWENVSYSAIGSTSGSMLVGHGKTTLDRVITVDVRQFGAKTIAEDPNFDSQPAFQAAIEYVRSKGGGNIRFSGHYKILRAPFNYTLPFDDGTYSPNFSTGEAKLDPEPQYTIPACLQLYSRCILVADGVSTSSLDFGWDAANDPIKWDASGGPIHSSQRIGIVARVQGYENGTNTRMDTVISLVGVDGFDVKNAFIGFLADGVIFNQSRLGYMQWANCGFPVIIQGADSSSWGTQSLINSYAGIIVGGMWLQRNNVQIGGKWVPPYNNFNDIYSLGWCDYLSIENLTMSGRDWSTRSELIDEFFDTYFYKSANSKRTDDGGRLTNVDMNGIKSDYSFDPWRGVAGRAFCLIARYKRGNSVGEMIKRLKVNYSPRVPVWSPYMGTSWYGYIDYAFAEQVGLIKRAGGVGDSNNFYLSGMDKINADQKNLPATVVEGAIQCQRVCLANTPYTEGATSATVTNDRKVQTIWVRNAPEYIAQPKTSQNSIEYKLIIDREGNGMIMERKWPGRYELQPIAFDHSDQDESHLFKYRIKDKTQIALEFKNGLGGTTVPFTNTAASIIHIAGRSRIFMEGTVPGDVSGYGGELSFEFVRLPESSTSEFIQLPEPYSLNYGSPLAFINVNRASIVNKVYMVGSTSLSLPQSIQGVHVAGGRGRFFKDQSVPGGQTLKVNELIPGSQFSVVIEYNTRW
ncbi:tail fiber/spike domain-containing protein [Serratia marcescens]|uniref:tail fiber/spike domain-containing protein n=1 Tax=Serratia marcescens TaxID=615 RepID=UPI00235FCE37|nr:hypothetical protein [Serratia marcescens]